MAAPTGVAWVGDYLPEYKLSPELKSLLDVFESNGIANVVSLLAKMAAAERNEQTASDGAASAEQAALWYLLQSISVRDGLGMSANRSINSSSSGSSVRIEVTLASALPEHAINEASLQAARDTILAQASGSTPADRQGSTPAEQAAAAWKTDLLDICSGCVTKPRGSGLIGTAPSVLLTVPLADLPVVVSYLTAQSDVHWLSPASEPRVSNYYGTSIGQSGQCPSTYSTSNVGNSAYPYNDEGKHPIWSAGLTVRALVLGL